MKDIMAAVHSVLQHTWLTRPLAGGQGGDREGHHGGGGAPGRPGPRQRALCGGQPARRRAAHLLPAGQLQGAQFWSCLVLRSRLLHLCMCTAAALGRSALGAACLPAKSRCARRPPLHSRAARSLTRCMFSAARHAASTGDGPGEQERAPCAVARAQAQRKKRARAQLCP